MYIVNSTKEFSLLGETDAVRLGIVTINLKGAEKEVTVNKVDFVTKSALSKQEPIQNQQSQRQIEDTMKLMRMKHKDVFSDVTGKFQGPPIKIQVSKNAVPIIQPRRGNPLHYVDRLEKELKKMLDEDIIEGPLDEEEPGTFISNLVITDKKGTDQIRVTLDCQSVNKFIIPTHEPIPTSSELRHKLRGADRFSKLDMTNCYYQFEIEESARKLYTFRTPWGIYRYKRMVMGTSPASSEVQKKIREMIQKCPNTIHIKDDIIVYGKGSEHDTSLDHLLSVLKKNGVTMRPHKCELGKEEILWFGNIFSKYGMSPDPDKCSIIKQWPAPKSAAEVKSFLQTVQFNSKFLTGQPGEISYPELTKPLRDLTKKNVKFKWTELEDSAFQELKKRLCSDRVVVPFDTALPTRLYVDSSYAGTQATIAQEHIVNQESCWRPVDHSSRAWTPAESRYSQMERESNGILTGMCMNRMYTMGTHVEVVTDHEPLIPIYSIEGSKERPLRVDSHIVENY